MSKLIAFNKYYQRETDPVVEEPNCSGLQLDEKGISALNHLSGILDQMMLTECDVTGEEAEEARAKFTMTR